MIWTKNESDISPLIFLSTRKQICLFLKTWNYPLISEVSSSHILTIIETLWLSSFIYFSVFNLQIFFGINSCWRSTKTFGETLRWAPVFLDISVAVTSRNELVWPLSLSLRSLHLYDNVIICRHSCSPHSLLSAAHVVSVTVLLTLLWYVMVYSVLGWIDNINYVNLTLSMQEIPKYVWSMSEPGCLIF